MTVSNLVKTLFLVLLVLFGSLFPVSAKNSRTDGRQMDTLLRQARQGDTRAMCRLALVYYHGDGVLKEPVKAKCLVKTAYDLGDRQAKKLWNDLALWQYGGSCEGENDLLGRIDTADSWQDPVLGMRFIRVAGGCYRMGCHDNAGRCGDDEHPRHRVCLDTYWIGQFEVTQGQWQAVMGTNPSRFKSGSQYPVERVTWQEVREFIRTLNSRSPHRFALPTEAQWEFACRSRGRGAPFAWGREDFRPQANCGTCDAGEYRGRTAPVGSFPENGLGLFDMGGNVREWCRDAYDETAYERHKPENPVFREKTRERVVRGGAYADTVQVTGCTRRHAMSARMKSERVGFRLVVSPQ